MTETFLNEMSLVEREQLLKLAKAAKLDRKSFEVSKIAHVQPRDHQPLSFAQQRLWFLTQLEGASEAYHISRALRLEGDLDRAALRSALDRIVLRHEALRTTFVQLEGETVQRVLPEEEGRFHLVEQDLLGRADAREALDRMVAREAGVPFDLGQGPLIRGLLLRLAEEEHVLVITMHHIVSDGWSMNVLVGELSALYGAFRKGEADPLPPLEVQYIDYAAWQRQWVTGEVLQRQADYWKAALEGVPALLEIPKDHGRPAHQDFEGALVDFELDPELTKGIKALSLRHGVTPFMTLLAAWTVLLSRLSGQEDLVVGTPVANRGRAEIEGLIGFFVNTLALRLDLSGTPTVGELLGRVKARALSAQHHQDIPFEQVVEIAHPVRSLAHSPLFQVMFAWQSGPEDSLDFPGLSLTPLSSSRKINAKFDLTLTLQEKDGTISGDLEYATALFDRPTIERYLGYLRTLVAGMVEDEARTIDRLPLLTAGEGHQLLVEWNATEAEYPTDACVHELFEAQAAMTPEAIALEHEGRQLSYRELDRRANRLAHRLREAGVKPDARVAICAKRSLEMVVGLLGVLKAGGAYVPLDPAYPVDRLRYMIQDAAPAVLLTQGGTGELFPAIELPTLDLEAFSSAGTGLLDEAPDRGAGARPEHLAYVIYTSGSTGAPKGVAIEHRNAVNFITWGRNAFSAGALETTLFSTSLNFDLAVFELYVPLSVGAKVSIVRDALACAQGSSDITLLNTVPSVMGALLDLGGVPETVQHVNLAGEPLSRALVERIFSETGVRSVRNLYGPSETTTYSTGVEMTRDTGFIPSIGRPVSNTRIYVLDAHGQPVPRGVLGEIHIGGAGVARGYLNRPELSAERFLPDPFAPKPEARMYRTGDLGRWLPDGNLEFLGRNDFQVKVRGFRIELGEIEGRLLAHPGVREAVVVAREDAAGEKRLVAFYTGIEAGAEGLRAHLSSSLPEYMVPAACVWLEALPLTPNGKLHREALPFPEAEDCGAPAYEAPVGETEAALATIWAEVLKVERVGRQDHFFELGGHSLMASRLILRVQQDLDVALTLRDVFVAPILSALAQRVRQAQLAQFDPLEVERLRKALSEAGA